MSDRMNDIIGLLESELEAAFEVRDKESLHRYVVLMSVFFTVLAGMMTALRLFA